MRWLTVVLSILVIMGAVLGVNAQQPELVTCGENLASAFASSDDVHLYSIEIETGMRLIVHADPLPISSDGLISLALTNAQGSFFDTTDFAPEDVSATLETDTLLTSGTFQIAVAAEGVTEYQLLISCVTADDEVISDNNLMLGIECGGQVDNMIVRFDELHRYYIALNQGDSMTLLVESLDTFSDLRLEFGIYSPDNFLIDQLNMDGMDLERSATTGPLPETGMYRIYVRTVDFNEGTYRVSVSCELANGSTVNANRDNRVTVESTVLDSSEAVVREGVEGVAIVDDDDAMNSMSSGMLPTVMEQAIVLPIESDVAETTLITPDLQGMFAYEFTVSEFDIIEITVERPSGLNLGVIVLSPDGETVFLAGLVTGTQLSTQLLIPADGAYIVGLYPLNVEPTNSDSAARVTTVVTINP